MTKQEASDAIRKVLATLEEIERENDQLRSALGDWVEYFSAIERREVGAPREQIRTIEKTFLDAHRKLLGWEST